MVQGSPLRKKIFPSEFSGEIVVAICGLLPLHNSKRDTLSI